MDKVNNEGWIEWDGGECPIPWAKAGEFEVKFRDGSLNEDKCMDAIDWGSCWEKDNVCDDIVAYRLLDGWIPIVDEKCPDVSKGWKSGEYDIKISCGDTKDFSFTSEFKPWDIVAIRRIEKKKATDSIKESLKRIGEVPLEFSEEKDIEMLNEIVKTWKAQPWVPTPEPKEKPFSVSACLEQALADVRDGKRKDGEMLGWKGEWKCLKG